MLCERCRCIGLDADGPNGLLTETFDFELKDSYSSLKHSAEAGCECCTLVMNSLETSAKEKANRRGLISLRKDGNVRAVKAPYIDDIGVHFGEGAAKDACGIPLLRIFTTDEDNAARDHRLIGRKLTRSIDAQIEWIKKRLRDCESNHSMCIMAFPRQLPTRLLDLQYSDDNLLLVDAQDTVGHYAALSHCWGPPSFPPSKTTLGSITSSRTIALKDLTEVFRQAVEVTRRLDIGYLWIDALCIIQDSPEDWEYEASRMASVYQNAHLTIATSSSANSHTKFFRDGSEEPEWIYTTGYSKSYMEQFDPDNESKHQLRTCAIPYESALTERPGTIYLKEINEDRLVRTVSDNADAPLQSRAWTLQERILSPRMVFFDDRELMWECSAGTMVQSRNCIIQDVSNRWAMYVPSNNDLTRIRMSSQGMRKALLAPETSGASSTGLGSGADLGLTSAYSSRLHDLWLDVLTAFGQRSVTYNEDALIAIAGIASRMQSIVKDTYWVGIWEQDFRRGLLWLVEHGSISDPDSDHGPSIAAKKSRTIAPSWSWASRIFQPHVSQFVATIVRDMIWVEDLHDAQLVNGGLCPQMNSNPVDRAKLFLRGFACSVVLSGALFAQWRYPSISCHFHSTAGVSTNLNVDDISQIVELSENGAGRSWNVVFECLMIGQWAYDAPAEPGEERMQPRWYGLLLRQLYDGDYERVGQVSVKPQLEYAGSLEDRVKQFETLWRTFVRKTVTIV